ncbi:lengsin isoform X1 [Pelobates cultripes]|uniref:Lengsin n=1 Tax=Pelobates cultripes TaxID=61616 RepID=A0AAD1RF76_PELCU|nr:lengsin isoform X1 [Pelobates cultripes]
MDNETTINSEELAMTENDEIDGSVLSRIRRKRGVKVTGKYIPPLEWEKKDTSHTASFCDQSNFEKVYDGMENSTDSSFQTIDRMSTKLLLKEEKQGFALTNNRREDTTKMEQEKQRKDTKQVESPEAVGSKSTKDVSQEKIKDKKMDTKHSTERVSEELLPLGSAIPKETLEELKNFLKESPLFISRNKHNPKQTTPIALTPLPKTKENLADSSGLAFETFRPNMENNNKLQPLNTLERKESNEAKTGEKTSGSEQSQLVEEAVEGKHSFLNAKSGTTNGKEDDQGSVDFAECKYFSEKDLNSCDSGIQNSLHLITLVENVKQQIAREDIRFVRFEAADLHGVSRSKIIPSRLFHEKTVNGIYMPRGHLELIKNPRDVEMDNINAGQSNSDIRLKPDLTTFRILPWLEKTGRVICDTYTISGNPLLTSPRYLAKQMLNQLQESGFSLHSAFTYEFCAFGVADIINSKSIAFPAATLLTDHDQLFMQELFDGMYYTGGSIESFSSSSGPGQMEISFQPEYGLTCADNAFTFRTGLKEIAKKHGYIASFHADTEGFYNSGLLSHCLWNANGTKNLFSSDCQTEDLTEIGKKWLSGLLTHAAAISCLVAPGVSRRKHFSKDVKDSQDRICATWGSNDNRCVYNIKCHGSKGTYIENKLGSATANPYLVLAATIAAGLDGIKRNLNFFNGANSNCNLDKLSTVPLKLEDALSSLEEDTYITAALGETFIRYFVTVKQYELETEELDSERNTFLEYFI